MINSKITRMFVTLLVLSIMTVSSNASSLRSSHSTASLSGADNYGTFMGMFFGPHNEQWFENNFDLDVDLVETLISPEVSEGFLSIFNTTLNADGFIVGGQWAYSGPETISYIVLTAGPVFAFYNFTDGANTGFFSTVNLNNKPFQTMSVYSSPAPVPLPAAVWLLLSACLGLVGVSKRSE